MLEELFKLVKEESQDIVVNNPDIPNEQNDEVVAEATNTVASGLRNMVAGGGLKSIISLFQNNDGQSKNNGSLLNNPLVSMMIGHFAGKLSTKYNMDENKANNVANSLIPNVLGNLVAKSNDPSDNGFSLEKLLNSITGGKTEELVQEEQKSGKSGFNFRDLISKILGGGDNKEGGGGLMDIITKVAGGALSQQKRNGGGGLLNLIKGFFKK